MDINFELYKVFYYVAKTLSFSEASKALFISQSAVSQSIKVLEKRLNQSLFIRSTKKVKLTKEGELLYKHIEPAINLIHRGETQILEAHSLNGGQLRIGASDTICRYFLVPYLEQFHKKYPNVHIKVTNGTSLQCVEFLETNQVDLIIINSPNKRLTTVHNITEIKEFSDVFVVNKEYIDVKTEDVALSDLQKYPILMLEKISTTSEFLHGLFLQNQLDLVPAVELSSNDLLIDLAKIGLGIAFVPDFTVKDSKELTKLQLKEELPKRKLSVVHNQNIPLNYAAENFIQCMLADLED